ncbi:MAG: hypothetical protein H8D56_11195 [Planctomycetes bacterium]|nr:hypothetical protein [Planctomycetota bacterium]MBL7142944.1 hypothetical protein [Phycisphaerae bacterium]
MRSILQIISLLSLIALTLPSVLFLAGRLELDMVKWIMILATIVWFVTASLWMWKDNGEGQQETG